MTTLMFIKQKIMSIQTREKLENRLSELCLSGNNVQVNVGEL